MRETQINKTFPIKLLIDMSCEMCLTILSFSFEHITNKRGLTRHEQTKKLSMANRKNREPLHPIGMDMSEEEHHPRN